MHRVYRTLLSLLVIWLCACREQQPIAGNGMQDTLAASVIVDPLNDSLHFFWKDADGFRYGSLGKLRASVDSAGASVRFAMNGGMYLPDGRPQGLYIESGRTLSGIDSSNGNGNFYLKPNGIFSVSKSGVAKVVETAAFRSSDSIRFATQSGPMLLVNGAIHPAFNERSTNLNIRNGVGILDDGRAVFAISRRPVNFYGFASWFRRQGCRNALYLDGFVSRAYIPSAGWEQLDGDFGVIIAVVEPNR